MPLSKHHIDTNSHPVPLDLDRLASALEEVLPQVVFAYLHGSTAQTGVVSPHSDMDVALFPDPYALAPGAADADAVLDAYAAAAGAASSSDVS